MSNEFVLRKSWFVLTNSKLFIRNNKNLTYN